MLLQKSHGKIALKLSAPSRSASSPSSCLPLHSPARPRFTLQLVAASTTSSQAIPPTFRTRSGSLLLPQSCSSSPPSRSASAPATPAEQSGGRAQRPGATRSWGSRPCRRRLTGGREGSTDAVMAGGPGRLLCSIMSRSFHNDTQLARERQGFAVKLVIQQCDVTPCSRTSRACPSGPRRWSVVVSWPVPVPVQEPKIPPSSFRAVGRARRSSL